MEFLVVLKHYSNIISQINEWIELAGGDITVNYLIQDAKATRTSVDETNPMWVVLENTAREL